MSGRSWRGICARRTRTPTSSATTAPSSRSRTTGAQVLPERTLNAQYFGDVREIPDEMFEGVDAVVHLAAVSNDPMGNKFERVTEDINYRASVDLGRQGEQGRRIAFRLRLKLQRLWLCAGRGPQGDGRTQSADRLRPFQGEYRKGTCPKSPTTR